MTAGAREGTERNHHYTDQRERRPPLKKVSKEQHQPGQQKGGADDARAEPDESCVSVRNGRLEKRHHVFFELMQLSADYSLDQAREKSGPLGV